MLEEAIRGTLALGLAKARQEAEEQRRRFCDEQMTGRTIQKLPISAETEQLIQAHENLTTDMLLLPAKASQAKQARRAKKADGHIHYSASGRTHGGSSGSFDGEAIYAQRHKEKAAAKGEIISRGINLIGTAAAQAQRGTSGITVSAEQQIEEARRQQENASAIIEANEQYKRANQERNWAGREELIQEYRRLQAGSNVASDGTRYSRQARDERIKELRTELEERDLAIGNGARNYSFVDDAIGVVSATGKGIASSGVNMFSNLGQLMAKAEAYSYSDNEYLTDWILGNDPNAMRQRKIDAYESDDAKAFWNSVDAVADKLGGDAAEAIQRAKEGKGFLGELGIDAAKSTLEMGFDAGLAALSGGSALLPMAARLYGQSVGQARQAGATLEKQAAYGLTSAGIEVLSEKLFDGVAKIYGVGMADDVVDKVIMHLSESKTGQGLLKTLAGAAGEGVEEVVSDLLSPLAERTYNPDVFENGYFGALDPAETVYDFLLGAAVSFLGAGTSHAVSQVAEARRALHAQDADGGAAHRENEQSYLDTMERLGYIPKEDGVANAAPEGTVEDITSEKKTDRLQQATESSIIKKNASGALVPDSLRAEKHAEQYYESVRHMSTDVQRIAKNTGFSESDIMKVKAFIFEETHDLGYDEPCRFFPSFEMAQSWQRLMDGKKIEPHDYTLLNHELLERQLMLEGLSQEEAHLKASEKFNYAKESEEYYGKIKKHKKNRR